MRILLAEDDELLGAGLRVGLQQQGFQVDWVRDGQAALRELLVVDYEAAVLDLGMPGQDGLQVLEHLRALRATTPVLILTARDSVEDRIRGLDTGADDYLVKPFALGEVVARLRALIRRAHGLQQTLLQAGNVQLDPVGHVVIQAGQPVDLAQREYAVLHALMRNPGRILSREQLEAQIYAWGSEVASNAVEVHVSHLRRKLGASLIETVRGLGYRIGQGTE